MSNVDNFDEIVLTSTYDDIGEKICSNKQRLLFEKLSNIEKILYTTYSSEVISTDLYGSIQIQSIAQEDRLFFQKTMLISM